MVTPEPFFQQFLPGDLFWLSVIQVDDFVAFLRVQAEELQAAAFKDALVPANACTIPSPVSGQSNCQAIHVSLAVL